MFKKTIYFLSFISSPFIGNSTEQTFFLPRAEEKNRDLQKKKKRQEEWRRLRCKILNEDVKKKKKALEVFRKKIEERHAQFKIYKEEKELLKSSRKKNITSII